MNILMTIIKKKIIKKKILKKFNKKKFLKKKISKKLKAAWMIIHVKIKHADVKKLNLSTNLQKFNLRPNAKQLPNLIKVNFLIYVWDGLNAMMTDHAKGLIKMRMK